MTCDYLRWAITGGIPALTSTPEQRDAIAEHLDKCPRCEEFMESRANASPVAAELRAAAFKLGMSDALRKKDMNIESMLLTEADFRAKMTSAMDFAKGVLDEPSEGFMPHLFVYTHDADKGEQQTNLYALMLDFDEAAEKYPAMEKLGASQYAARQIPLGAVLITEAWSALERPGDKHVHPRDNPNREEILQACGLTVDGKVSIAAKIPIARIKGMMRPCSGWQWVDAKVTNNLLIAFFQGFRKEAMEKIGFVPGEK